MQTRFSAAAELRLVNHANGEIRAVVGGIVQALDVQVIEVAAAVCQILVMLLPGGNGIVRDPGGIENVLPQLFNSGAGALSGEHLLCPGCTGHGGNAPLLLVFPAVNIGLENGIGHSSGLGDLFHVDTLHAIGIFRYQNDAGGNHVAVVFLPCLFPFLHRAQALDGAIAIVNLAQWLIVPLNRHLRRTGLIGFIHHHLHKFRLIQVSKHQNSLTLLHIGAAAHNQVCIFSENRFFHFLALL